MAGHTPQIGCFKIYRASVTPPNVLLLIIQPELDIWKGWFSPQVGQINDLTAIGATNLLFYLQEVILQNLVVLRKMFPSSPIQNHPIFQYEAYLPFAQKVETYLQQEEEGPSQLSILYQAVLAIADCLKTTDARNDQRACENDQRSCELQALIDRMAESQWAQSSLLQLLTSGSLTFWLKVPSAQLPTARLPTACLPTAYPPAPLSIAGSSQYASARASAVASPSPAPPQLQPQPQLQQQPQQGPESKLKLKLQPEQPPVYRICYVVKSVRALWREWTKRLRDNPSVAALDSKQGTRWRAGRQSEL